jgi:hypothetical protein
MLKWESAGEAEKAQQRMNSLLVKVGNSRVLYVLLVLAAFILLSGASDKWTG